MKASCRFFAVVVLFVMSIMFSPFVASADQGSLVWNVRWGVPDDAEPDRAWTYWSLSSDPTAFYRTTAFFAWAEASSDIQEIGPGGITAAYAAWSHCYQANGFQIGMPDEDPFAGMTWYMGSSPTGPEITLEKTPERRITVVNTTGRAIFVTYSGAKRPIELGIGQSWSHPIKKDGTVVLRLNPDDMWSSVAEAWWRNF